jgi:SAM-dependent methyltransferase
VPDPAQFDSFAAAYESALAQGLCATGESADYFARGRVQFLRKILTRLNHKPANILDFGCGTGTSIPLLLALPGAQQITGVDISPESLKIAAEKNPSLKNDSPRAHFATFQSLAPSASIDLAFCNGVFHHIPLAERPAAMKYVFDSLRPGGIFAFWENNPWNPGTRYIMSRIPFDRDAVTLSPPESRRLVQSAGFDALFARYLFFFPKSLSGLRWLEPAFNRIPLGGQYLVISRKP